ncbi:hypothetical protein [Neopusillimonas maritima]|nr:hypothetical protein [Neopusillimonas maritima]
MENIELKINLSLNPADHGQLPWISRSFNLSMAVIEPLSVLGNKSGLVFSPTLFEYKNLLDIFSKGIYFDVTPLSPLTISINDYYVDRSWGALHHYFEVLPAFDLSVFTNNLRNGLPLTHGLSAISEEKHGYISALCIHWMKN